MVTYTPIGEGAAAGVTYKFLSEPSTDRAAFRITEQETKHITAVREEELAAGYSDAERETRLEGIPQLGSGRYSRSSCCRPDQELQPQCLPLMGATVCRRRLRICARVCRRA